MHSSLIYLNAACVILISIGLWYYFKLSRPDPVKVALSRPANHNIAVLEALDDLEEALPERVLRRSNSAFEASLRSYWAQPEQCTIPAGIVQLVNTDEVAKAVGILHKHLIRQEGGALHFAVRSGGHAPTAGSANVNDGITIDLSKMNGVELSEDRTSVMIQPAARWVDVYSTLQKHGLATVGGRVSSVGVGGLTLGGGISYFSPRKGFVCDGVLSYELVLADGQIIKVNNTTNQDLFTALKGGSNNFGIVTQFTFRTFEQGQITAGYNFHWAKHIPKQIDAFYNFCNPETFDEYANIICSLCLDTSWGVTAGASMMVYTKPDLNARPLKPFIDIPHFKRVWKIRDLTSATDELNAMSPPNLQQCFRTATFENNLDMLRHVSDLYMESRASVKKVKGLMWAFTMQPLPPCMTAHSNSNNALGIKTDKTLVIAQVSAAWKLQRDSATVHRTAKELMDAIEERAKAMGVYNRYTYLNYSSGDQDPIAGYGEENKKMMQDVSRKYDPHGLFQRGCVGGFKVFKDELEGA